MGIPIYSADPIFIPPKATQLCRVLIAKNDKLRIDDDKDRLFHLNSKVRKIVDCDMPYLLQPSLLLTMGISIRNNKTFPIKFLQGDRIGTLVDEIILNSYAIVDPDDFAYKMRHKIPLLEDCKPKVRRAVCTTEKLRTLAQGIHSVAPRLTPDQLELLEELRRSRFAKHVRVDDRWEERILMMFKDLRTGDAFNDEQARRVKLICLAFADRFFLDWRDTPAAKVDPMRINTYGKPTQAKARPVQFAAKDWFAQDIKELVDAGIFVKVYDSEWSSPAVVVDKRTGGWRACTDYRLLNKITITPQYPIPRLEDMVQSIRGMNFLAAIDMKNAYQQLPLHPDDQHKSVQINPLGCYKYTRVPFGLSGAPAYFQARLKTTLDAVEINKRQLLSNYMDDILVGGNTYEDFEECLIKFFEKFREIGFKVGGAKSLFGTTTVEYLGYSINAETRSPLPDRIEALMKREAPKTLKELRGLVSSLSFWNQFLPFMADKLEPLMEHLRGLQADMGKKRSTAMKFKCSEEAEKAWTEIKDLFAEKIFLHHIDPNTPFYIFCDASDTAAGSVIFQKWEKDLRPVAFFSKIFSPTQRNYMTSEREFLAVMLTLDKFKLWLASVPLIHLYTDHASIVSIVLSQGDTTPRMTRWRNALGRFNIRWHYLPGKHHGAADFLSRPWEDVVQKFDALVSQSEEKDDETLLSAGMDGPMCLKAKIAKDDLPFEHPMVRPDQPFEITVGELSIADLIKVQKNDEFCQLIRQSLENACSADTLETIVASRAKSFIRRCHILADLVVVPNLLLGDSLVPVVPAALRRGITRQGHVWEGAHLAVQKTYELLAARMAWPNMRKDVETFVSNCETCVYMRPGNSFQVEPGLFVATDIWDQVTIDVMHMQKRHSDYKLALVAIDTFSRYCIVMPLKTETAKEQMQALRQHVLIHGAPKTLVLDRHPVYTSKDFLDFCKTENIKLSLSPGYSSNHVALVNRVHRTLKELFAKMTAKETDWTKQIARVTLAYNSVTHPATGFPPYFLFHARRPNTSLDRLIPMINDDSDDANRADRFVKVEIAKEEVVKKFEAIHRKQIADFMRNHSGKKRDDPKVGEKVFKILPIQKRDGGKLAPVRAVGPYFISKLDKTRTHATIVQQYADDGVSKPSEHVKINDLIPIGNRIVTPVFANTDFIVPSDAEKVRNDVGTLSIHSDRKVKGGKRT